MNSNRRSQKVMRLLDLSTGLMKCTICGATHHAMIRPDSRGNYCRGSWRCQYGCKPDDIVRDGVESPMPDTVREGAR